MSGSLQAQQEEWRKQYIYPLQKMFSAAGVFFTTNVLNMDRHLEDIAEYRKQLTGDVSTSTRMDHFVSPEAAALYRQMLQAPFPY